MLRLILMRHAKSDWNHIGTADHDRPLNKRGRRAASALGDWLRAQWHVPDEVMCSSAERTGQTLMGLQITPAPQTRFIRALYLAEPRVMIETLHEAKGNCVLMIGHNHGICDFASLLVETPPVHERFADYPTGATLVCDFDVGSWQEVGWHQGRVIDFIVPRELTG